MTVVGADDEAVVAHVAMHLLEVVVQLDGDPDVVLGEGIGAQLTAAPLQASFDVVQHVGDPVGAELDDAPLGVGEALRHARHQQRVEG